jgi:hypothetical protein
VRNPEATHGIDVSFCQQAENKREQKASNKKSDLYLKIMREHGKTTPTTHKLNYDITSLN